MKKLCTVKGWNGEDVEVFRSGNRVRLETSDHILEFNDLELPFRQHMNLLEDLGNLLTAFESYTDSEGKYGIYSDYDLATYNSFRIRRCLSNIERRLMWGDEDPYDTSHPVY